MRQNRRITNREFAELLPQRSLGNLAPGPFRPGGERGRADQGWGQACHLLHFEKVNEINGMQGCPSSLHPGTILTEP